MTFGANQDLPSSNQFEERQHDVHKCLGALFNRAGEPLFIKDDQYKLLLVNDAFCDMFRLPRSKIIGKTLSDKVLPSEHAHYSSIDKQVLKDGKENISEEKLTIDGEQTKIILTRKNRFIDPKGNHYLVGVIHDITQRKQTELREQSRSRVLEKITSGESLPSILELIVEVVEQEFPEMLCSVLLLNETGKNLYCGAGPSLPTLYNEAINGIEIGEGVGSCGTAAFTNERVIVEDIQSHPYWQPYKELAQEAKLGSCWSQPIRSTKGKVLGTFAIYHHSKHIPKEADLSLIEQTASLASIAIEKKQAEEKLKRAASVFTHAHEGIMITDSNANIIEVNDTFSRITGYSPEEALGKNPSFLQSGQESPDFYSKMWATILEDGNWSGEIWNRRKNGEIYPEMLTISTVKNTDGKIQHYVSLSTDITANKANIKQLKRIAHYDLLTNLPNRVLLADRLNQAIKHCQSHHRSLAVAFMDLDGFKEVNDTYGHSFGDELLIAVSKRMQGVLRKVDTLARIGGDEFIAIMVDLDESEDSELVFDRLLTAAADPVIIENTAVQVSASIGVTRYPQDSVDAEQLIRHADQAMYMAKQAGKNRYHLFDTAYNNAMNTQHKSIENIRSAVDKQEFILHYQPKVNMRTGEVIGAEALIRWQHPINGLIPPLEFLPVIEGHAISLELGEWVINSALTQISQWQSMGLSLPISVNISAYQIQQDNFTARLATLLSAHPNVNPDYLELEILETSALHDIGKVSATMNSCHKLGVLFALDDFGTGYSSLTYLKRLPAHQIKIDQSFVRDMLEDADDLAIVEGVVGLAKAFQREVIAEGVESQAHGLALLKLGCELAQGFGIARPMPAGDITKWISNWEAKDAWHL